MRMQFTLPYIISGLIVAPSINAEEYTTHIAPDKKIQTTPRQPTVTHSSEAGYDVIYMFDDGTKLKRRGGTRAWRNSNPGNLRYTEKARENGAIGQAGGFAVFPDEETGARALENLLLSDSYKNLTIANAIFKYAPPSENDTHRYRQHIQKTTGLNLNKIMADLSPQELSRVINAIRIMEGWKIGQEMKITAEYTKTKVQLQKTL